MDVDGERGRMDNDSFTQGFTCIGWLSWEGDPLEVNEIQHGAAHLRLLAGGARGLRQPHPQADQAGTERRRRGRHARAGGERGPEGGGEGGGGGRDGGSGLSLYYLIVGCVFVS